VEQVLRVLWFSKPTSLPVKNKLKNLCAQNENIFVKHMLSNEKIHLEKTKLRSAINADALLEENFNATKHSPFDSPRRSTES
jgi:hypothetical protein